MGTRTSCKWERQSDQGFVGGTAGSNAANGETTQLPRTRPAKKLELCNMQCAWFWFQWRTAGLFGGFEFFGLGSWAGPETLLLALVNTAPALQLDSVVKASNKQAIQLLHWPEMTLQTQGQLTTTKGSRRRP
jgi:hypothetical protein